MSRSCMRACTLPSLATILVALVAPISELPAVGTIVLSDKHRSPLVGRSLPLATPAAYRGEARPLRFEPNMGQCDPRVRFVAHGANYTLYLTAVGAVFVFAPARAGLASQVVRWSVVGANPRAVLLPQGRLSGVSNYVVGRDPRGWRAGIPGYARVVERDALPGADLIYDGSAGRVVPRVLLHRSTGLTGLRVVVHIEQSGQPSIFQTLRPSIRGLQGRRTAITSAGSVPVALPFGRAIGALSTVAGLTSANGVAVDAAGQVYVVGQTDVLDFPMAGRPRPRITGRVAFVSKLSAGGRRVLWSVYLGGSQDVTVNDVAVDMMGQAYVTGQTGGGSFPTTPHAYSRARGAAFLTKLSPDGRLIYSTLFGSVRNTSDTGNAVAVDRSGAAYVTGGAGQSGSGFPTTPGAFQRGHVAGVNTDAFVAKFSPDGSRLVYSTLLGNNDVGGDIALDGSGHAVVVGTILINSPSTSTPFPTTAHAYTQPLGTVFVAKLSPDGRNLIYGARLGGVRAAPASQRASADANPVIASGTGIALDGAGQAYLTGSTYASDFPTTPGAAQPRLGDVDGNAFVAKLSADGARLLYSTYLGGTTDSPGAQGLITYGDAGAAIAVDRRGDAYVTGATNTADFPTTPHAFSRTRGGAFVSELAPDGRALLSSTRLGGSGSVATSTSGEPIQQLYNDEGADIAVDATGHAYIAGTNQSTDAHDFPTTPGAVQSNTNLRGASATAFVSELTPGAGKLVFSTLLGGNNGVASS